MVLENNVQLIVMLTKLSEASKQGEQPMPKCDKYWPSVNKSRVYHDIRVDNVSEAKIDKPGIGSQCVPENVAIVLVYFSGPFEIFLSYGNT
jgi:protein tyrosine phosphatase